MNKYSDKSDFEINKAVAEELTQSGFIIGIEYHDKHILVTDKYANSYPFDPCNNPADAMPIVKDNLISLEHDGIAWQVSCVRHPEISVWDGCENYNDNFYRKAMELFLLMKDAENEK
ncbi:DUF2591 family protein [Morganella morganii]|uniref:phage protein NinX family protein n=1 Tax=Morganella morganii TaxID=582 RepID=UPI00164519AF|nr:phage protein NinX family protein [Morganella morganii]MBC4001029.1 DUF2591 family protein [Morganella morganii]